jgi:hypothetical protein
MCTEIHITSVICRLAGYTVATAHNVQNNHMIYISASPISGNTARELQTNGRLNPQRPWYYVPDYLVNYTFTLWQECSLGSTVFRWFHIASYVSDHDGKVRYPQQDDETVWYPRVSIREINFSFIADLETQPSVQSPSGPSDQHNGYLQYIMSFLN